MKNKLLLLFILSVTLILQVFAQSSVRFENGYYPVFQGASVGNVFDVTSDGKIAVTVINTYPDRTPQVTSFDPITGKVFDKKVFNGFDPTVMKIANLEEGTRIIVSTTQGGPGAIIILDMDKNGLLTQRARVAPPTANSSIDATTIVSSSARAGFTIGTTDSRAQLVSFSLDTGAILSRIEPNQPLYGLSIYEDSTRRILVSGYDQKMIFFDASDPSQLKVLGNVTLPGPPRPAFGDSGMSPVFSADGRYVFAGNSYSYLSAVDTITRQVVGSLTTPAIPAYQLKINDDGNTRLLAVRSAENSGDYQMGFSLIDATNPNNLSLIKHKAYNNDVFRIRDFVFSHNGKRLLLLDDNKLTALSIPELNVMWENQFYTQMAYKIVTFGRLERILAAWSLDDFTKPAVFSIPNRTNRQANFDLDNKTDISVFRPSTGGWYWLNSKNNNFNSLQFGQDGDIPVAADYDGDDKTDIAVFRPSTGGWYRLNSTDGEFVATAFGTAEDKPTIGDFDGDGKADIAVFRPSTGSWYRFNSSNNQFVAVQFGTSEDKPVTGDYDADGKSDIAVYRPSTGGWYRLNSSSGNFAAFTFGTAEDKPVPADYDFDGITDIAVFRPSNGTWYIQQSFAGFKALQFGLGTDIPVPADYDGDGRDDIAVYRDNTWYMLKSTEGFTGVQFGAIGDKLIPNALEP